MVILLNSRDRFLNIGTVQKRHPSGDAIETQLEGITRGRPFGGARGHVLYLFFLFPRLFFGDCYTRALLSDN
jgi:hypothetical protein